MQNEYFEHIKSHEAKLKKDNIIFNILGYAKLFFILIMGLLIYLMFADKFSFLFIGLFAAAFIALVILWACHVRLHNSMDYSKGIISICNRHIDRITGKWISFEDIGKEFIDADHAYACDLDIVGQKSLFQLLNTTRTWYGRRAFADDLLRSSYKHCELEERQAAVIELSGNIELSNRIQYYLSKIGTDSSITKLADELKDKTPFIRYKAIKILLTYAPAITIIFIAGITILQQKNLYPYGALLLAVQAVIWVIGMPKTHKYLGSVARLPYKLSAYSEAINILTKTDFSSEKLKKINEKLDIAAQAIKDLSKIADKINVKSNGIINFIINVILLWDYECAFLLENWKDRYAQISEQWLTAVGEFESLLCLSHLPGICDNTCLPVISEKGSKIEAKEIGHPLLLNESRVNNEIQFNNNIFIISGSNMSGKTTFLRTVGINLVLARSGGFVCAEKMTCSLLDVMTSMRIADDLNEGVSTFYAELKRIKRIIDSAETEPRLIFLIDEIFRGTNSVDRLIGAKTVIAKLNVLGVAGLISTHDLELCEFSDTCDRIKNYSFLENYADKKICFDYKIKKGKSNTTNAKYLMEMVGINYSMPSE